jgi:hypothetical protein
LIALDSINAQNDLEFRCEKVAAILKDLDFDNVRANAENDEVSAGSRASGSLLRRRRYFRL